MKFAADYAQSARNACRAFAYVRFPRNVVKMQPLAFPCNDTLCTEHGAVYGFVLNGLQSKLKLFLRELMRRFQAPAGEHFVCMVMPVVFMTVVVPTAAAFAVLVVMLMVVFMVAFTVVVFMVVPMVTATLRIITFVGTMFVFRVVTCGVGPFVIVPTATAFTVFVVVFVMTFKFFKLSLQAVLSFDCRKQGFAVELVPFGGNDGCRKVLFT